jgi:hypothetical protein
MKYVSLLLLPAALFAGQARYARLGEFEGKVEVQLRAGDAWTAGERNLPLVESAWLRTGASSRLEIELDEGSAWRLGPDSQVEISDYAQLSTGQRVTVLSLDRGLAYFTGEPGAADTLTLAVPGAQVTLLRGARVRLQVDASVSRISVLEGVVRFFCPAAEIDIREGQTVRVEPAHTARFDLDREVPAMDLDRWNEDRDKTLAAASGSASHVAQRYGVADLDVAGTWVQTDLGAVWKPKVAEGWAPFQNGRWRWYDTLGYTWVSDEAWGWIPYHHGRWTRKGDLGWVWAPASSTVFKPGDVYWLYNAKLAGWGPLGPGEDWQPPAAPEQFLNVNTTYAAFKQDARAIDPAGFQSRPKDPLSVAFFALALPSPAFPASRLEATRPVLRVGATRLQAVIPGTTFPDTIEVPPPPPPPEVTDLAPDPMPDPGPSGPPPDPGPPGPPMQVIYPAPSYTGIVVLNPPEHPDYSRRNPNTTIPRGTTTPATTTTAPTSGTTTPGPTPPSRPRGTVTPPETRPPTRTAERPSPVPTPIGRELPRVPGPRPAPSTTTVPAPTPTGGTTTPGPTSPPTPRVTVPVPHPATPSVERPSPAPTPISRELPRASTPAPAPDVKPAAKVETKTEVKADPKTDVAPVKKQ